MGVNTKDVAAENGSSAMGMTRKIALAKMYTTPKDPHTLPNAAMAFENGQSFFSPFAPAAANKDVDDGFDCAVADDPP